MRFLVRRVSVFDPTVPPCDGVTSGEYVRWDLRDFRSPEEFDEHARQMARSGQEPETWFGEGTDHEVIRGPRGGAKGIRRKTGVEPGWFLEIGSLEDLLAFQDRHGELILTWADTRQSEELRCIEIYDGYRE